MGSNTGKFSIFAGFLVLFRSHFVVLQWLKFTGLFECGHQFLPETLFHCFSYSVCASFCDKKRNLSHIHRFLLQTKHKATDKKFGAMFPEGIDGHLLKTTKMIQKINAL